MSDGTNPRYTHDCSHCVFLGQHGKHDLYFCDSSIEKTVIGRDGNDGPEYSSGMCFSYGSIDALTEARQRAQAQGLVDYDLRGALHAMPADAAPSLKAELEQNLLASELGQALTLLSQDLEQGTAALRAYVTKAALAFKERFPDKDIEDLKSWARSPASNAYDWMRRLGLPCPNVHSFTAACFDD